MFELESVQIEVPHPTAYFWTSKRKFAWFICFLYLTCEWLGASPGRHRAVVLSSPKKYVFVSVCECLCGNWQGHQNLWHTFCCYQTCFPPWTRLQLVLKAVQKDGSALMFASEELQRDKAGLMSREDNRPPKLGNDFRKKWTMEFAMYFVSGKVLRFWGLFRCIWSSLYYYTHIYIYINIYIYKHIYICQRWIYYLFHGIMTCVVNLSFCRVVSAAISRGGSGAGGCGLWWSRAGFLGRPAWGHCWIATGTRLATHGDSDRYIHALPNRTKQ